MVFGGIGAKPLLFAFAPAAVAWLLLLRAAKAGPGRERKRESFSGLKVREGKRKKSRLLKKKKKMQNLFFLLPLPTAGV